MAEHPSLADDYQLRKETLDRFADTLVEIISSDADLLHDAPHSTPISRPDEVTAARKPVLKFVG